MGKTTLAKLEKREAKLAKQGAKLQKKNREAAKSLAKAEERLSTLQKSISSEKNRLASLSQKVGEAEEMLLKSIAHAKEYESLGSEGKGAPKSHGTRRVTDVRFEDRPNESLVIIEIDGAVNCGGRTLTPNTEMLQLRGAKLKSELKRSLDTQSSNGPVGMITSFREGGDVKVIVSTRDGTKPKLVKKKGQLIWKFPRKSRTGSHGVLNAHDSQVESCQNSLPSMAAGRIGGDGAKWRGKPINIELQDAEINDVLLLLSDIGRVSITAGECVTGQVTMRLNSVPWDQALHLILDSLNLGLVHEDHVIRVATISDLDAERPKAIEGADVRG